ncbi:MAG TPA: DUF2064 domain-containing protein [Xanthomonadales bacterium]|nr:DUF2064 domain-containing protein [Xanthomonadales bacterium]
MKTRLAAALGSAVALDIYRASVACVRDSVTQASRQAALQPYWAIAEPEGASDWGEWPLLVQPAGDLGTRMAGIYRQLRQRHRGVLLLGADAPAVSPWLIAEACAALGGGPARVIAPADDGGFVLFGANVDLDDSDWTGVPYSAANTAARFIASVGRDLPLTRLDAQQDLDTVDDLVKLQRHPPAEPTAAQKRFWEHIPEWLQA